MSCITGRGSRRRAGVILESTGDNTVVEVHGEQLLDEPTKTRPLRRRPVEDDTLPSPPPPMPERPDRSSDGQSTDVELHPPTLVTSDSTVVDPPVIPEPWAAQELGRTHVCPRMPSPVAHPAAPAAGRPTLDLSGLLRDLFFGEPTAIKHVADERDDETHRGRRRLDRTGALGSSRPSEALRLSDEAAELRSVCRSGAPRRSDESELFAALLDHDDLEPPEIVWHRPHLPTWLRVAVTAVSCLAVLAVATLLYAVVVQW